MTPLSPEQREELGRLLEQAATGKYERKKVTTLQYRAAMALPALLASAERESRLEKALRKIWEMETPGPEMETEQRIIEFLSVVVEARAIARAALNGDGQT